jgi:hypothetical protein
MPSQIETDLAKALDLLNATQIVALYLGLFDLRTQILADPHPRKNNAAGRAYTAETLQRLLANELQNGLARRDPGTVRPATSPRRCCYTKITHCTRWVSVCARYYHLMRRAVEQPDSRRDFSLLGYR